MTKSANFDDSGDSDDLQALFDSIAASCHKPEPSVAPADDGVGDSEELQALFDQVSAQAHAHPDSAQELAAGSDENDREVYNRLGQMARQLHDTLHQLGYDRVIEDAARQIPDARQRLIYIVQMTEQAASKVLNATDIAKPLQDELLKSTRSMSRQWDRLFANELSVEEFKALAAETREFFSTAPAKITRTNEQLSAIMMAQDFQDLTGQVIRKVVDMAQSLEAQLVRVLIDASPAPIKADLNAGLMNGPVVCAEGRQDVVTSQSQVDELLESLGF